MKTLIDPEVAYLPPTYIYSTSKVTAKIINEEKNHLFKYEWRIYPSKEEEERAIGNCDVLSPEEREKFHSLLLFKSDIISIEPISGEIWPEMYQQFVITFNPEVPFNYKQIAYLYNLETEDRIPYEINANGLHPTAEFSVDQIDVAHISLDIPKTYTVRLINTGEVPFDFEFEKRTPVHLKFRFSPINGHLNVGESTLITIDFAANYVGQFNEMFRYKIVGFPQCSPAISLYGRIIGASFVLSREMIDFGNVSYGFLYSQNFTITNTSDIPFDFALSLKQEQSFDAREFSINPSVGSIPKFGKKEIVVEFIPIFVQDYNVTLQLEGTKSEEQLGTINLIAKCLCPPIAISEEVIDLGVIFINHEYTTNVTLVDDTDFPAKYEFIEFDDQNSLDLNIFFLKYRGSIGPHTTCALPIKVTPRQLGHLELQRSIRIYGSNFPPITYTIKALCAGPKLLFESNIIDFGNTPVLQDIVKVFSIQNDSLIPAVYSFEIKNDSMFRVEPEKGEIEAGKTLDLKIIANLDDSIPYSAKLIMNVKYLTPMTFDIKAKGTGTAIVSTINMKQLDLGFVFTVQPAVVAFTLTNQGRRNQELKWSQQKPKVEGNNRAVMTYKVVPDTVIIAPKESVDCQFIFECNTHCSFNLTPVCQASIGRQRFDLFKPEIKGIFIKPMVVFSSEHLTFKYVHNVEKEEKLTGGLTSQQLISPSTSLLIPITQGNTLKNNSDLPLDIEARCDKPFVMSHNSFFLQPGETMSFDVTFITNYKKNFTSEILDKKIHFTFRDNPHKYIVNLKGIMVFPNISFSPNTEIKFGILLKGTEETRIIKATNTSSVPARFFWELKNKQSFDLYPINDVIEPNETKDIHITFYAGEGTHFKNTAVCHVIGGPEYPIELSGSSATIDYTLSQRKIDFGKRDYREQISDQVKLTNNSLVPINYAVKLPKGLGFQHFSIDPQRGNLNHKDSVIFNFKLVAGLPRTYNALFMIQIGHFDEAQIDIHIDCYIPQCFFSIPRLETETNIKSLESERKHMTDKFVESNKNKKQHRSPQRLGTILIFRGVVLSNYVIDFGEIILGDHKIHTCEIKNITPYPISFDLLTNALNGTGFSVNNCMFRDVPPNETITLEFKFISDKRSRHTGKIDLEIPMIFSDELGYMIHLKADIKMPVLYFSKSSFNFDTTIVGQKWIQTLQLQNMDTVPVSFSFEECEPINVLQRGKGNKAESVFTANPTSGTLPPMSFLNIEVCFAPTADKNYQMQFPINVQYSDKQYIQLKGSGTVLKLQFDPPEVTFNPIQPFSEKSIANVDIINNTSIGMEVFSQQYDFRLLCQQLTKQFLSQANSSQLEESVIPVATFSHKSKPANSSYYLVSKFSTVVVVHGPPKSGRSTISQKISELYNIPVLSLKSIWTDKLELPDEELISIFQQKTSSVDFMKGFVIDGLDVFSDGSSENEQQFIMHFLKQKSTLDELAKNPYTILSHPTITAPEKVMNLLLSSLDGQYFFFIGLNANENVCNQHMNLNENEEKQLKMQRVKQEMESLFNMDENDYMKLPEEEKKLVDQKREHFRKYKIEHDGDISEYEPIPDDNQKSQITNNLKMKGNPAKKAGRGQVQNDPLLQSVILFQYTFGRLAESARTETKKFRLYNNHLNYSFFSQIENNNDNENNQQIKENNNVNNSNNNNISNNNNTNNNNNNSRNSNSKEISTVKESKEKRKKDNEIVKSITNSNCLLVNSMETVESVLSEILLFLPKREVFFDKVSKVPHPWKEMPDQSNITLLPFSELFSIVNDEHSNEFPEYLQPQTYIQKNKSSSSKKNNSGGKENFSPNLFDVANSLTSDIELNNYSNRWIIPPNSRVKLTLAFDSAMTGSFQDQLLFGIVNCRNDLFQLPVKGTCAFSDIDRSPRTIFPKIANSKTNRIQNAFILSSNEFYFGSLLIVKEKTKNAQPIYKATMNLVNNSDFLVETNCYLQINGNKTPWILENAAQTIKPGETGQTSIGFNPSSVDIYRNKLTIMVKDNPEPIYFNLFGEGCSPTCEISTNTLDFDKLLINMSRTLNFTIKNIGKISAFWKIKGGNVLGNNFTISQMEGNLSDGTSSNITITYSSEKAYNAKKPMQIEIYDINKSRVFMTHHMTVSAESFDVLFEFLYPKLMDNLNFGVIKVGQEKVLQCFLKNKGKYPNSYKIFINKNFNYKNLIKISPDSGVVPVGDKGVMVNISYKADFAKKLTNCKAISLRISDPINDKVTNTIALPFTVESVFSSYELKPENCLDFGPLPVSTTVTKEIKLRNNGVFAYDFEVFPKIEIIEEQSQVKLAKNGKNRGKTAVSGNNGKKLNPRISPIGKGKKKGGGKDFFIDHFHVSNSSGQLNPDTEFSFNVSFNSIVDGVFENTIIYKISDCVPKLADGFPLKLRASVFIPGIVTDDFEKIFPDQHLCLRYDIMKRENSAFIEDEQLYHFSPVILKESTSVGIALINPLPIPCTVDLNIKPRQKNQQNKYFPFELSTKSAQIQPNSTVIVECTFTPQIKELFKGLFEATVRGGLNANTKLMKFGVEGAGTLPSVIVVDNPHLKPISFGKTLVNTNKHKRVTLQNNGIIPVKLTVTASGASNDFELENIDTIQNLTLDVNQLYCLHVNYCPLTNRKSAFSMHIGIIGNPDANIDLNFAGEGFREDVVFEGIKGDENELCFNNVIGQQQQITFNMHNVCDDDVRFQWPNHSEFTFTPRIGQLRKGELKKIAVNFVTDKPMKFNGLNMKCQWTKIHIENNDKSNWDDSMKVVKFVERGSLMPQHQVVIKPPSAEERPKGTPRRFPPGATTSNGKRGNQASRIMQQTQIVNDDKTGQQTVFQSPRGSEHDLIKVVEIQPEPSYQVLNHRQKEKDLQLRIFAVSDFIKYDISTQEIEFLSTMMFEKRSMEFNISNASQIRFEFNWRVKTFGSLRTNYSLTRNCPFTVEPKSGFIEADQTVTFTVNFLPEEVDDFSAHLVCEIPFLTQMEPPEIYVSGRSKRPVCHFYLETSDYLSAGRRHPDYTDALPDDVKVVEMFAYGLKKSTTKKFGILNATDTPYEIVWEHVVNSNTSNKKEKDQECPITCDYPRALVSSGRTHYAQFSYKAVSVKTVESLWIFSIPEYNIRITFLIVGRMMPH